jgi:SAM-dependent methyltransferase
MDERETNLSHWDTLARLHGNGDDRYYDVEALIRGETMMTDLEEDALAFAGGVAGKDVLHIQCHLGFDAITFAQRGARVTAIDFSRAALDKGASIAKRAGVEVTFIEADATALPASLARRFDLAYASIGAICWIADLRAWMRAAAATLRPGGRLVLMEVHPFYNMLAANDPLAIDYPYAFDGPRAETTTGTYANPRAPVTTTSVSYAHDLGETVTAAVEAGLRIDLLREHLSSTFDPRGTIAKPEPDGRLRVKLGGFPIPMFFTLVATLP